MESLIDINLLPPKLKLKKFFHVISILIIILSLALLAYPFSGFAEYAFSYSKKIISFSKNSKDLAKTTDLLLAARSNFEQYASLAIKINKKIKNQDNLYSPPIEEKNSGVQNIKIEPATKKAIAKKNTLLIPKINVDIEIVEGNEEEALFRGAWRIPETSSPDLGGNTVIAGHRWRFKPPSKKTFYNLDKLAKGDEILILWQGKEYRYKVRETKVIKPEQLEILNNTSESILTLFTCTPLFSTKFRLVVIADLI